MNSGAGDTRVRKLFLNKVETYSIRIKMLFNSQRAAGSVRCDVVTGPQQALLDATLSLDSSRLC